MKGEKGGGWGGGKRRLRGGGIQPATKGGPDALLRVLHRSPHLLMPCTHSSQHRQAAPTITRARPNPARRPPARRRQGAARQPGADAALCLHLWQEADAQAAQAGGGLVLGAAAGGRGGDRQVSEAHAAPPRRGAGLPGLETGQGRRSLSLCTGASWHASLALPAAGAGQRPDRASVRSQPLCSGHPSTPMNSAARAGMPRRPRRAPRRAGRARARTAPLRATRSLRRASPSASGASSTRWLTHPTSSSRRGAVAVAAAGCSESGAVRRGVWGMCRASCGSGSGGCGDEAAAAAAARLA